MLFYTLFQIKFVEGRRSFENSEMHDEKWINKQQWKTFYGFSKEGIVFKQRKNLLFAKDQTSDCLSTHFN
jgi:ribosomal protein L19E